MSPSGSILLIGGTGQVGCFLLPRLLQAGFHVLAPSRRVGSGQHKAHPTGSSVTWLNAYGLKNPLAETSEFSKTSAAPDFSSISTLISTGPIRLANELLELCPALQRVICLSTSSIFTKAESTQAFERQQMATILAHEKKLSASCRDRNIRLVRLYPTMIYGCGMDENITIIARWIKRFGFVPLAGQAHGLRQPVHAEDLAEILARAAVADLSEDFSSPLTGGSTLAYSDMVRRIFQGLGKKSRILNLPGSLLAGGARLAAYLPGLSSINPAMIDRQNLDLVFDDSIARQAFGFQPRQFRPGPDDYEMPDSVRNWQPLPSSK